MIKTELLSIPGVILITPQVFGDERGFFKETWNQPIYAECGISETFVQDNLSKSSKGVLRGLHYQNPNPQGKLVYVIEGEIYDVVADIRVGSPTYGQWVSVELTDKNHKQLYVPPGFAHGFCVLSDTAIITYKCTTAYDAEADAGIAWNDPDLNVDWPVVTPSLSDKDIKAPLLSNIDPLELPVY